MQITPISCIAVMSLTNQTLEPSIHSVPSSILLAPNFRDLRCDVRIALRKQGTKSHLEYVATMAYFIFPLQLHLVTAAYTCLTCHPQYTDTQTAAGPKGKGGRQKCGDEVFLYSREFSMFFPAMPGISGKTVADRWGWCSQLQTIVRSEINSIVPDYRQLKTDIISSFLIACNLYLRCIQVKLFFSQNGGFQKDMTDILAITRMNCPYCCRISNACFFLLHWSWKPREN